jgi:MFS family permease
MFKKLTRDHCANCVTAEVLGAGVATPVSVKPGDRVVTAGLEFTAEHVAIAHRRSIRAPRRLLQAPCLARAAIRVVGYWQDALRQEDQRMSQGRLRELWAPEIRVLTVGLILTITVVASESLAVITVMPLVARDLGGVRLYGWASGGFMLSSVIGVVVGGRENDRHGPALPFAAGLVLFSLGLVGAGLAPSMGVLVLGRVLQGLGSGVVPSVAYASIGRSLPPQLRARMIAVISTAWVVPGLVGPALSAEVAHAFGWRWVFIGLLPVVGIAGSIALPALARLGRPQATQAAEHKVTDAVRASAGTAMILAALTIAVSSGEAQILRELIAPALIAGGLAVALPALRRLVPPGTLTARPGLPATILSRGLLTFAFFGTDGYVTLAITAVRHDSPLVAGFAVTGATVAWTGGAWTQARLSERWEGRRLIRAGLVVILLGVAGVVLTLQPGVPVATGIAAWTIAGFGMGLAYSPILLLMLRQATPGREGRESASLNLADALGTAAGLGAGGTAVAAWAGSDLGRGVATAFAISAGVAVLALAVSRRLPAGTTAAAQDLGRD